MVKMVQMAHGTMPKIGLGTWDLKPIQVENTILNALKIGYRHIDCAPIYGNEKEIGATLQKAFNEGIVKREDLWITSKLWCDAHHRHEVKPALQKTLDDLQLDYLDLYLIHWPVPLKHGVRRPSSPDDFYDPQAVPFENAWLGMHDCYENNLVRNIGVSNFSIKKISRLIDNTSIVPVANQVERHLFLQQNELLQFCLAKQIQLIAYSPVGQGNLELLQNSVIKRIANKYNCTPAQLILSWGMEQCTVIPKSSSAEHQKENFATDELNLLLKDRQVLQKLDKHHRCVVGSHWTAHGSKYYSVQSLWDE